MKLKHALISLIALIGMLAMSTSPIRAAQVSSNTQVVSSTIGIPALLLFSGENLAWRYVAAFATGSVSLQQSADGSNWYETGVASSGFNMNGTSSGTLYSIRGGYYRWNVSSATAGSWSLYVGDVDDVVFQRVNHKNVVISQVNDDSANTFGEQTATTMTASAANFFGLVNYQPVSSTTVSGSTVANTLVLNKDQTITRNMAPRSYITITSTGGAITLAGAPTISTSDHKNGDVYVIDSATATITFSSDVAGAGTKLMLGAATRALSVNDVLILLYRDGLWKEIGFFNN